jgi:hypothetical protein
MEAVKGASPRGLDVAVMGVVYVCCVSFSAMRKAEISTGGVISLPRRPT